MPKRQESKPVLFYYEDIAERVICPNCRKLVKMVVPATIVTYLVHPGGAICVLENNRGLPSG